MRRLLAPVLLLTGLGLAQETGYNTNWTGHRTLHINTSAVSSTGTNISANVLKYPMLVRLGAADSAIFIAAKAGGADIRLTKSNNTERLKHQIETWDAVGRRAAIWVLLDTVYANNLTQNIRLHWGNAGAADSSNGAAVFDSANGFAAVWHMGNAAAAAARPNSVPGGKPATPAGTGTATMNPVGGLIGMADTLRSNLGNAGNDDHFTLDSGYAFAQGTGSISIWVNMPVAGQGGDWNNFVVLSSGASVGSGNNQGGRTNNIWIGRRQNSNDFRFGTSVDATVDAVQGLEGTNRDISGGLAPLGEWHQFTVTFQDTMGRHRKLYRNGVQVGDFPRATTLGDSVNRILPVVRGLTFLGRSAWGDRNYRGKFDEVRISNVARSNEWIALDYASQNPAQTLLTDSTAPTIAYAVDSIVGEVGFTVQAVLPVSISGVPHPTVTISPALPAGLTFTTTTTNRGMISGTPTAAQARTMHVITATNAKGTFTDTIYVTVAAAAENYATWTGIKTLSFTSPASATVNRFPFLLRLTNADSAVFAQAGTGGVSLRFSRTDAIKLKYSIDHWDAVNRKAGVWVLMDQVVPGANTLRMHWGNGSATSQSSGPSVFEAANGYMSVWHMGNPIGDTLGGSRPNMAKPGTNDARPFYATTPVASMIQDGAIGKADSLRGQGNSAAGDHFHLDSSAAFSQNFANGISMSLWIKPTSYPSDGAFVQWFTLGNRTTAGACPPCAGTGDGRHSVWLGRVGNASNFVGGEALNNASSGGRIDGPAGSAALNQWQYYTMTILGTTTNGQKLYRNGMLIAQRTSTQALQTVSRNANFLGRATWNDPTSTGILDEARVSNVIRDSNWVKLEYASQRPGAAPVSNLSYASISGTPGAAITPRSPTLSGTAVNYTVTGTLPAGIVFNDTTGVFSGTPTGPGAATVTVTANSGVWSASTSVTLNFGAPDGAYATAWSGHKFISVNATTAGVTSGNSLKFPLLVRLGTADSAIFNASQATGADIRFTKLDNATRLKHEIDTWDKANLRAAIWVLVDTVYGGTTGSRLRMHYGNANVADSSKASAVFDSASYLGVWHMGNVASSASPRPNAVAGGFPATPAASVTNLASGFVPSTGMIGMADTLRGQQSGTNNTAKSNDDHFNLGNSGYVFTGGQVTLSMWILLPPEWPAAGSYHHFLTFGNGTNAADNLWMGRIGNTNTFAQRSATSGGESTPTESADALLPLGQWANFTITRSGTNGQAVRSYKNGASIFELAEGDATQTINAVSRTLNYIGRANWGDPNVRAKVDEVRALKVARDANWVKLEYANQNAAQNLVALTDAQVSIVTGINNASTLHANGPALSFTALGKGLLFQVRGEASAKVRIAIIDMFGRTVWNRTETVGAGMKNIVWNGYSNNGADVGSGIYVVRMNLLDAKGLTEKSLTRKVPLTH